MNLHNATGRTMYCEDCGAKILAGEVHACGDEQAEHDFHTCECSACCEELHAWCNNVDESGYDAD